MAMTRALALLIVAVALQSAAAGSRVVVLDVRGPIGPAISDFVSLGLAHARDAEAAALILRMDTPGGLDTSMRAIIKTILAAPMPVITYVSPGGARAASAGTYILYASHVAAMAPATNLGAATPIPIGPGALPSGGPRGGGSDDGEAAPGADPKAAMQRKIVNDAVAYLRAMAELRGRNADWAEKAVREGASLSAEEALAERVIDVLAPDLDALLEAIDGRAVDVLGETHVLATAGWVLEHYTPDWRTRLLAVLTNPNIAYLLLLIGIYGLMFEFYSPGALVPGVVGVIALVLAMYALHLLPVNYAGVALLLLGIGMMVFEGVTPSFGAIGAGGIFAFVAGSVMLFDTDVDGLALSIPLVATIGALFAGLLAATMFLLARQRGRPVVTGREEMIGSVGRAQAAFSESGHVVAHGERWAARTDTPVAAGQQVRIDHVDGLTLAVVPLEGETGGADRED